MSYSEIKPSFQIGPDGIDIGLLGIGTRAWGARRIWGYGLEFFDKDLSSAFDISFRSGITFLDTAEIYGRGHAERLLGNFIQDAGANVLVATKYAPFPWRIGRKAVTKAMRGSLERLDMFSVDLYQIHWPYSLSSLDTLTHGLADTVSSNLAKMVGVSNFTVNQMKKSHHVLAKHGVHLSSNQVHFSLLHRQPEENGLLDACSELGALLIAYSPLEMGLLSGKYSPENPPPGQRGHRFNSKFLHNLVPLRNLMREIGEDRGGKSPSQVAINWVIAKGAFPIPGVKNALQAADIVEAMSWSLTESEVATLDKASEGIQ